MPLTVKKVLKNTPAQRAGVMLGDKINFINDISMNDFIDTTFCETLINPTLRINRNDEPLDLILKKEYDDGIGLEYEEELYPDDQECVNGCIFCFVDQLPDGMRESLYVRDDDWRYSVLYGNYITMTNMTDEDFERIVTRNVSPLYISVHSTDPNVRYELMRNKKAKLINEQLQFLYDNKIIFHSQIVLCPSLNDGESLKRTIRDMSSYYPYAKTLSIVPVGLTGHREGLPQMEHVSQAKACEIIQLADSFRNEFSKTLGEPFVYVSDEFYAKAQLAFPRYEQGEINAQKANGVGLFSDFLDDMEYALEEIKAECLQEKKIILITGVSAYNEITNAARKIESECPKLKIECVKVENTFFGESITVAGLLTGYDIIKSVEKKKADAVFVPESALRDGANVFLDDMSLHELENKLGTKIVLSPNDGYEFVERLTGGKF